MKPTFRENVKHPILIIEKAIELFHFALDAFSEENSYEFFSASTYDEALDASEEYRFKLVLVGSDLGNKESIKMISDLKGQETLHDIPFVLVANASLYDKAFEAGAIDFIRTPIEKMEMVIRIKSTLSIFKLLDGMKEQADQLENQQQTLRHKNMEIEEEKKKTDELLSNILPREVAEQLKNKGVVEPKRFRRVTVMFADFVGFTKLSEMLSFQEIVHELGVCFQKFDEIIDKHFIEKIKTIGDAYMCAGGLPIRNKSNPIDMILASLKIYEFINRYNEQKKAKGEPLWEIRLGMHTGEVIAGVIGTKKFAYDIWGDTVNTASRMQSSSDPGRINVSGATYNYLKDYFDCEYRGKVEAKNKGQIDMYYVNGLKEAYRLNGSLVYPNAAFLEILSTF